MRGDSRSYSSVISPTISSRMSSIVTSPAVPPYSSMTTATCTCLACISRSSSSTGFDSGMKYAGRMTSSTFSVAVLVLVDPAGEVLEVGDAEDVVLVLTDDRDAGEAAAQRERQRLPHGLAALDPDHVGARHHDLAGEGVAELEDGVDHLPLAALDHLALLGQVDQLAQLGLGRERAVAEAAARA